MGFKLEVAIVSGVVTHSQTKTTEKNSSRIKTATKLYIHDRIEKE